MFWGIIDWLMGSERDTYARRVRRARLQRLRAKLRL
jgi:hypothetical protein